MHNYPELYIKRSQGDVAIVVTCYNQRDLIETALLSVLGQSRLDAVSEIVVVDDGSSDGSNLVLHSLQALDSRIRVVVQSNGGAASARNAGIHATSAPWIAFLDGDDAWLPEKLDCFLASLDRFPGVGLVCSDFFECDHNLRRQRRIRVTRFKGDAGPPLQRLFLDGGPILPSTAMLSRKALEVCGGFDESFRFNEDPELWLRIADKFAIHCIGSALTLKRDIPGSLGSSDNAMRNWESQRRITENALARHPVLRAHRHRRLARDYARLSYIHAEAGHRSRATLALLRSLSFYPLNFRVWLYALAIANFRLYGALKSALRRSDLEKQDSW